MQVSVRVFARNETSARGLIFLPGETDLHELRLNRSGNAFKLDADPLGGKVSWEVTEVGAPRK